jgi:hypothetical protein
LTNEPDFHDLVGDEGDREQLERLRRVHDLLVAAGPPPELSPAIEHPPAVRHSKVREFKRRRPATVFALAAVIVGAAFFIGYAVADRRTGFSASAVVPMRGTGRLLAATAEIRIGSHDSGGNYPLEMTVSGLPRLPRGGWYELLLSKNGRPTLPCGGFAVDGNPTTIKLSVPYDLTDLRQASRYDGWIVIRHVPTQKATPIVMTTRA